MTGRRPIGLRCAAAAAAVAMAERLSARRAGRRWSGNVALVLLRHASGARPAAVPVMRRTLIIRLMVPIHLTVIRPSVIAAPVAAAARMARTVALHRAATGRSRRPEAAGSRPDVRYRSWMPVGDHAALIPRRSASGSFVGASARPAQRVAAAADKRALALMTFRIDHALRAIDPASHRRAGKTAGPMLRNLARLGVSPIVFTGQSRPAGRTTVPVRRQRVGRLFASDEYSRGNAAAIRTPSSGLHRSRTSPFEPAITVRRIGTISSPAGRGIPVAQTMDGPAVAPSRRRSGLLLARRIGRAGRGTPVLTATRQASRAAAARADRPGTGQDRTRRQTAAVLAVRKRAGTAATAARETPRFEERPTVDRIVRETLAPAVFAAETLSPKLLRSVTDHVCRAVARQADLDRYRRGR